jgi:hypothetical protein
MTALTRSSVRLSNPGELLAAVPHLLGFHPHESMVLIALSGPRAGTVGMTLRADLPPPEQYRPLAEQVLGPMLTNGAKAMFVVLVGGDPPSTEDPGPADLPYTGLVDVVEDVLSEAGVPVAHALWTRAIEAGERWYCYDLPDCRGELEDPRQSPLAAATALAGVVTFDSREDLVAQLRAVDEEAVERRSAMLDAELTCGSPMPGSAESLALLRAMIGEQDAPKPLDDRQVIRLTMALVDHVSRDACLYFGDPEQAARAERLWTTLVREMPEPERAEPACMLAFSAYLRGDGALAGIALDIADEADPMHQLSVLLREILDRGMPPSMLAEVAVRAADQAQAAIDGTPPGCPAQDVSRRAPPVPG